MNPLPLFALQMALSLAAWSAIAVWLLRPWLQTQPFRTRLMVLISPQLFRHVGVSLLVPALVGPGMPRGFALATAIGDTVAQLLALAALGALARGWRHAVALVWVFNVFGSVDMLHALAQAARAGAVEHLEAAWFGPTFIVPLMLVSHAMTFATLLRRE